MTSAQVLPAAVVVGTLEALGVRFVVGVPDSALSKVWRALESTRRIRVIQCLHEADAIALAVGLEVCGTPAVVMMECSGFRSACETLARLGHSHRLFCVILTVDKGRFGNPNWWAQEHHRGLLKHLSYLNFRWRRVSDIGRFRAAMSAARETIRAQQCGSAVVMDEGLI